MKRTSKYILLCFVVLSALIIASIAILQISAAEGKTASVLSEVPDESQGYIVKDCNGYVGVYYKSDEEYPAIITEISLDNLREYDRQLVESGFEIQSRAELMQLLEDLGS